MLRQILLDGVEEKVLIDGLSDVVIEARSDGFFPVPFDGVGGESHDRHHLVAESFLEFLADFPATLFRKGEI